MNLTSWNQAPEGFRKASDVVKIQNQAMSIMGASGDNLHSSTIIEYVKQQEIRELEQFYQQCLQQEQALYSRLGIANFKDFYLKTRRWQATGANKILQDGGLIQEISRLIAEVDYGDLHKLATQFTEQSLTKDVLIDIFGEEIEQLVGSVGDQFLSLSQTIIGGSGSRSGTFSIGFNVTRVDGGKTSRQVIKGTDTKATKGLTFVKKKTQRNSGNNIDRYEVHFTTHIPQAVQKNLKSKFTSFLKDAGVDSNTTSLSEIGGKIKQVIMSRLPPGNYSRANAILQSTLQRILVDNVNQVDVNKNISAIRGMLGEIYWNAFFEFIGVNAIPTGVNMKDTSGHQIPIDIMFEKFGFQVKNYTSVNGIVTFNQHLDREISEMVPNKVPLGTFLRSHLELGDSGANAIGRLFFSESYNQPSSSFQGSQSYNEYLGIYGRFEPIISGFESYIRANVDKLLKLNKNVTLRETDIIDPQFDGGRPTLFFINDMPIPASSIVADIIRGLKNFSSEYVHVNIRNLFVLPTGFASLSVWPHAADADIGKGLSSSQVMYTIDVDMQYLIQNALSNLNFF